MVWLLSLRPLHGCALLSFVAWLEHKFQTLPDDIPGDHGFFNFIVLDVSICSSSTIIAYSVLD